MKIDKKNTIFIVLGIVIVIGVIIILLSFFRSPSELPLNSNNNSSRTAGEISGVGYEVEGELTEEDINIQYAFQENEALEGARVEIRGASPISSDNTVLTYTGEVANNSAAPGSAEAPKVTQAISKENLRADTIMLNASADGFEPQEISTQAGAPTTISLTSTDDQVHVLRFDDPVLNAISLGVMPGETRAITFNAPSAGTYSFFCEVPGHKARGEVGVMIVR